MATPKPVSPDEVVVRYHGDGSEFFFNVPPRDLTAWEWADLEPSRRRDCLAGKTRSGKPLYTEVGSRTERLAEAGFPDVVDGADIPTVPSGAGDTSGPQAEED